MEAARRQAYLSALGIDVWVSRTALPGALPSLMEEVLEPLEAEPEAAVNQYADEYADYDNVPPAQDVRVSRLNPVAPAAAIQPRQSVAQAAATPETNEAANTPTQNLPRFALNFCHVPGAWLVCELSQFDAPDFNNQEYGLLKNILRALQLPDQLGNRAAFNWPMKIGPNDHKRNFPQGAEEAATAVMRTLNSRLQREPEPVILVFGKTAAQFLLLTQSFADARGKLQHWPMQKAHLLITESLTDMLLDARRKKFVWRDLQAFFTVQPS